MESIILPARVRDAEALLKLQYLCYQTEAALYDNYTIPPLTQSLSDFLSEYDTHTILVARLGEEIVGSVRGHLLEDTCHIGRLIVHPRLQGHGLGTKLMYAIEERFGSAARYELFTGHRSEGNLRLYRRLGYALLREETVSPQLRLVFLEKQGTLQPSKKHPFFWFAFPGPFGGWKRQPLDMERGSQYTMDCLKSLLFVCCSGPR